MNEATQSSYHVLLPIVLASPTSLPSPHRLSDVVRARLPSCFLRCGYKEDRSIHLNFKRFDFNIQGRVRRIHQQHDTIRNINNRHFVANFRVRSGHYLFNADHSQRVRCGFKRHQMQVERRIRTRYPGDFSGGGI